MAALDYLHRAGLAVELEGERLRVTPANRITTHLRQFVRDHRAELLAELIAINDSQSSATQLHDGEQARYILTAATASPEWLQARDRYINHLMPCRNCHAPTDRYCDAGADLHQRYDRTPME